MNLDKTHFILEEMIQNGQIQEVCKQKVLEPLVMLDKSK